MGERTIFDTNLVIIAPQKQKSCKKVDLEIYIGIYISTIFFFFQKESILL